MKIRLPYIKILLPSILLSLLSISQVAHAQKAIIVAGGGPFPGNMIWEHTKTITSHAYRALQIQGFLEAEDILLLSDENFDADSDGTSNDVDLTCTLANLHNAITQWAVGTDQLTVFLVDHGGPEQFRMSETETLSAADLDSWFDTLQSMSSTKIVFINESSSSGSFIPVLVNIDRILICSAGSDENAYFLQDGLVSFSNFFWQEISKGNDVGQAFLMAKSAIYSISYSQVAVLDDNGNGLPNEKGDGLLARNTYIGIGLVEGYSPPPEPVGDKAIVVVGGGTQDFLWDAFNMLGKSAYTTLLNQKRYTNDRVWYLSPDKDIDINGDGTPEVVYGDEATGANLQTAITQWASDAENLFVYLVDHGGSEKFRIGQTETVRVSDLDNWLDTIQATIPGKVIMVYDACSSGGFIPYLEPPSEKERIIITSTKDGEDADFSGGGDISFSFFFWAHMILGQSFYNSYANATNVITPLVSDNHQQTPQVQAFWGDSSNQEADFLAAMDIKITNENQTGNDIPYIDIITPNTTLNGSNFVSLFIENVVDADEIARAWAVVTPPGSSNQTADGIPNTNFAIVDLTPDGIDRWKLDYDGFRLEGEYKVAFFAEDEKGATSFPPKTTRITQSVPYDAYEDDDTFDKASIIILNDTPQRHNFEDQGDEDWIKFYALSSNIYDIKVSNLESNCNAVIEIYDFDGETILGDPRNQWPAGMNETLTWNCPKDGIYYVKIRQSNPNIFGDDTGYDLSIFKAIGGIPGTLKGMIRSATTGIGISNATLKTSGGLSAIIFPDGAFFLPHPDGTFFLTISAHGFETFSEEIILGEGEILNISPELTELLGDINGNGKADLNDVILVLQVLSGIQPPLPESTTLAEDRIELKDSIFVLQKIADIR